MPSYPQIHDKVISTFKCNIGCTSSDTITILMRIVEDGFKFVVGDHIIASLRGIPVCLEIAKHLTFILLGKTRQIRRV